MDQIVQTLNCEPNVNLKQAVEIFELGKTIEVNRMSLMSLYGKKH